MKLHTIYIAQALHYLMLVAYLACIAAVVAGFASCLSSCTLGALRPTPPAKDVCSMQHSWNNYHLADSDTAPVVVNRSSYTPDLPSWNELQTPIMLRRQGDGFQIVVEDGGDANSGWLGLATVRVSTDGHIQKATVTMNTTLLARYSTRVSDHVLCQELGHLLGLGHHEDPQSCMDDCSKAANWMGCLDSEAGTTPSAHDAEQLRVIYSHVSGDAPGPACSGAIVLHAFADEGKHQH